MHRKVVIVENRVSTNISVRIVLISPPFRRSCPQKPSFLCIAYIRQVWLLFKHELRHITPLLYNTDVKCRSSG